MKTKAIRWLAALCALCLLGSAALAEDAYVPRSAYTLKDAHLFYHGPEDEPRIALTMDDCYDIAMVERTLDLCKQYGVPVTFFPVGAAIKPEDGAVWRRLLDEGHEIGNHTYGHQTLYRKTQYATHRQLVRTEEALVAALGYEHPMYLARPPYGKIKPGTSDIQTRMAREGYPYLIMWNVDSTKPDTAFKATRNGSILLFHANERDVECLTELIPRLLEAGFEPVTVSALLDLPVPPLAESDAP